MWSLQWPALETSVLLAAEFLAAQAGFCSAQEQCSLADNGSKKRRA
jgi:hypothetical protein